MKKFIKRLVYLIVFLFVGVLVYNQCNRPTEDVMKDLREKADQVENQKNE